MDLPRFGGSPGKGFYNSRKAAGVRCQTPWSVYIFILSNHTVIMRMNRIPMSGVKL